MIKKRKKKKKPESWQKSDLQAMYKVKMILGSYDEIFWLNNKRKQTHQFDYISH